MLSTPDIAVYYDEGSGEFSRACLVSALSRAFAGRARVRRVRAAELCASDAWHERTLFLAIPGGAAGPYAARLNGPGNASIRRYLERGGALLGVCAGAYYVCNRIVFEEGPQGPIRVTGELGLFAGTARGCLRDLAAPYSLDHLHGANLARLLTPGATRELHALYWGGPEFLPDAGARYTPLLHYRRASGDESLAGVRVQVGEGRAVLVGVHAEITGDQFAIEVGRHRDDSFEHGLEVCAALNRVEADRRATFELLISALEL
jgi:glutamine amidotransferase-like uncharacterized protein